MTLNPPPCQYGATGWCLSERHDRCPYRAGGQLENGIRLPECYLTMPHGKATKAPGPAVIEPSHRYRCPCECHQELTLFGTLGAA